ncbi:MAG TPA: hypothetical protein VGN86_07200 [Pyrinomonadaceae bacterium]|nr:hypothetical protein [Pyrinomonadaceae bacterium]
MNIFNNTPVEVHYDISMTGSGDCGNLNAADTADWPAYDNSSNVEVGFAAMPVSQPPNVTPFTITIPESGTGMTVTIGIYQE